ncbi:MAG: beta-propeller domain-containing protein [bacterium]|nr:beta-propeller domain-containing protein [bacterium]
MKKFFSQIILIVLIIFIVLPKASAAGFIDVSSDHEYTTDIQYLKDNNIVQGYEVEINGEIVQQFRADYELNRAELVKIMVEARYTDEEINSCWSDKDLKNWDFMYFPDIEMDAWFAKYVCLAVEKNIIDGYPDGTFKPSEAVNFAEAAKIIVTAIGLQRTSESVDAWFHPFVRALANRMGIPPSVRSYAKLITRGEMARMIHAGQTTVDEPSLTMATLETRSSLNTELPQIDSCDALIEKLQLDQDTDNALIKTQLDRMEESGTTTGEGAIAPTAVPESSAGADLSADDYSQTNVQVAGVDEADIVKNDGKYIYLIKGKTIRIVDAYPGTQMEEIAQIELDDADFNPQEIYIDEDQLVIIGQVYHYRSYPGPFPFEPLMDSSQPEMERMAIWPGPSFDQTRMKVYIYDISDRSNPTRQRSIEIEGNYINSRKVDKNVYFVLNQWIPYYTILEGELADIMLPHYKDSARGDTEEPFVRCMDVQYFPDLQDRNYMIVAGLNIEDLDSRLNRKILLGSTQDIYASRNSLYVASPHYRQVERRSGRDISYISEEITRVYRFLLSNDEIEYQNQGIVGGTILNQFSMDESGNTFRIATTRDRYDSSTGSQTDNNIYVLNRDTMNILGQVQQIAPDERIKSVRFVGSRAYLVTFKNIDPLFVIDLSDALNPKILGELKVPGWSDYLHPYDETHLIGFGREVDPSAENAEFLTPDLLMGMKLSIFDVSDVSKPVEMFKQVIGQRGTTSELLSNHKALLFDKEKKLLAFPITITALKDTTSKPDYDNITTIFQGGIVYSVDLTNGFREHGKVTHYTDDSVFEGSGEYFYPPDMERVIQRLLYIGEYLYSVSPGYVRSYNLANVNALNFVKLTGSQQDDVDYLPE